MRILLTTDTVGGVWTYAVELCRGLSQQRVEIALATMGAPLSPSQWDEVRPMGHVHVFQSAYELEWMEEPWEDLEKAGKWLLDIEAEFQPDLIHLNGYAHGSLPWRVPTVVVAHSCVLSWFEAVKHEPAPASWDRYHRAVTRGLHAADAVVAPSRAMLDAVIRHYGPPRDSRVIHNGRSCELLTRPVAKEPIILSAGRLWDESKNVRTLAAAAPSISWPVYVAGEASQREPRVHELGKLSPVDLAGWFSRAAIYCLPARYEPFGLSILEAALARCALVVGDIPSLQEIWGDAALYVGPDDASALAATLNDLISNADQRELMSGRAAERAKDFSRDRMVQSYLDLYREMLKAPSRRTAHLGDPSQPAGGRTACAS